MKAWLIGGILAWSIVLAGSSYWYGGQVQANADKADQADAKELERKALKHKNTKALAAGVRTEKAQAVADASFQQIQSDYEIDQHTNPDIGCVLDPVSLRRWNEANGQSDSPAAGEPVGEVPAAAEGDAGRERGQ